MKLLGSVDKDVGKDKNGEDVPKLESVEVVLVHCNLVNNSYQQASKVLFAFVPNQKFGQLITISPHSLTMLKTTLKKKTKNFMVPFYGWGSIASRLEPLRGGSLLFTTKFPDIPGTHFIDLGRMKG